MVPSWAQSFAGTIRDSVLGIFCRPVPPMLRKLFSQLWSWHVLPWVIATIFSCGLGALSMSQYIIAATLMDGALAILTVKCCAHFRREFADHKRLSGIATLAIGGALLLISTGWIVYTNRQRKLRLSASAPAITPSSAASESSVVLPQVSPPRVHFIDRGQVFPITISNPGSITTYGNVVEFSIAPRTVRAADFEIQPDSASMRPLIVQPLNGPYPVGDMFWLAGNYLPSREPVVLLWIYSLQPSERRLVNLKITTPVRPAPTGLDRSPLPPPTPIDATIQGMVVSFNPDAEPVERRGDRVLITMMFPNPLKSADEALCLFRPAAQCIDGPFPATFRQGLNILIIQGWKK